MDVKSTFMKGELEEEVYFQQLDGFKLLDDPDMVCRSKKALNGLKQEPRVWYARLDIYLSQPNFRKGTVDKNIYFKVEFIKLLIVVVYVNDISFGGNDGLCEEFLEEMQKEFEMSMFGEMSFFLGLQHTQLDDGIFISQVKYVKEMLNKFDMENCKHVTTPLAIGYKLGKDDESLDIDQKKYMSMNGGLLYLTTSRLKIMQVVCLVAIFQASLNQTHDQVVERIFRYLKGTQDFGLWFMKDGDFMFKAYTNINQAKSVDERKSTSGGRLFLGDKLVLWISKKQEFVSLSTAQARYIAATSCYT